MQHIMSGGGVLCDFAEASQVGGDVEKWADIYAKCYYEIFQNLNGGSIFEAFTTEDELAVNVDQEEKTIVVGPYYLAVRANATTESKKYLYNQLIRNGVDEKTAFATYKGIKNMNCDEGEKPIFINQNGEKIKFPNFVTEEPFYIKFKPGNEGFITDVAKRDEEYKKKPVISVEYINGFTGDIIKYDDYQSIFSNLVVNPHAPDVQIESKWKDGATERYQLDESGAYYWRGKSKGYISCLFCR